MAQPVVNEMFATVHAAGSSLLVERDGLWAALITFAYARAVSCVVVVLPLAHWWGAPWTGVRTRVLTVLSAHFSGVKQQTASTMKPAQF
eukprot:scaffold1192_cov101-Isochrysis_galbana.AAC.2